MLTNNMKIAVIGAGTMGAGIAHMFAQNKFQVHLIDTNSKVLSRALQAISINIDRMIVKGGVDVLEKDAILRRIKLFDAIDKGVEEVDIVVEAIVEDVVLKKRLFVQLDQCCESKVILATNTSSISISKIASVTKRPERVIGMHFMNPVPLMTLVEVIKGSRTSDRTLRYVFDLINRIEKVPVTSNDSPGFVANRILMPMINEAIETLYTQVASVEAIDNVMKLGMGHPMGPLQLADYIGLDVCRSILSIMYGDFKNPKYAPNALLIEMVEEGELGVKSGKGFYDYSNSKKATIVSPRFL